MKCPICKHQCTMMFQDQLATKWRCTFGHQFIFPVKKEATPTKPAVKQEPASKGKSEKKKAAPVVKQVPPEVDVSIDEILDGRT